MIISDDEVKKCLSLLISGQKSRAAASTAHLVRYGGSPGDIVRARVLADARATLNAMPALRSQRVTDVKHDVHLHQYHIDSQDVAAKIIGRMISDQVR